MTFRLTRYLTDYRPAERNGLEQDDDIAFARRDKRNNISLWKGCVEKLESEELVFMMYELETRGETQAQATEIAGYELHQDQLDAHFPSEEYDLMRLT